MIKPYKFQPLRNMKLKHSAVIIIRDQKVLLIKRSEQEDSEPNKWCPPNETLEKGESPEKAVIRGVQEEIGTQFTITKKLFHHSYQGHTTFVFLDVSDGDINPNPEEVADYGWFDYKEAMRLEYAYNYYKVVRKLYDFELIAG